ncbi:hypothetical protein WV31_13240 [Magnetospirillum sp. ME-1]|uniref:B12-binding domain-containing radical SAM protein n=1 Tax=Magnetospirillum sp. ME-1 TaxID=1639348 RepID=UPI000A17AEB1|nr:cobalamin-dependent protein [Magnetospirillum sp. ME-1]ARJ66564.1 hypothetical protein WV31_13240 [Magnetospirillum sp. ME-1]
MKVLFVVRTLTIEGDPMGVMQLASIARREGWNVDLATAATALDAVRQQRPDLVAMSMMTTDYAALMGVVRALRAENETLPIVVGGPHPTFIPALAEEEGITAICRGEGDLAFPQVLERVAAGRSLDGIPNIATAQTPATLGRLVEDLDSLPFIDRALVYDKSAAMRAFRLRSFYSSRGCPYRCSYCFNAGYNDLTRGLGKLYRKRSVSSLIEEVRKVAEIYPTDYIRFSDDTFVLKVDPWLEEFAERFPREVGIPFYCLLRANTISNDMVRLISQAGAKSVCMSIEAANPKVRREILRREMKDEALIGAFDAFNAAGVNIYTNCILGFPNTGLEDDLATLDLAIRCRPAYCGFSIATPFPGTELHDYCRDQGVLPEASTEDYVSTQKGSLLTCFTPEEKRRQVNLVQLAPLAVRFPILRNLAVAASKLPCNVGFFLIHFVVKNYLFMRKIVPIRFTPRDVMVLGWNQLLSVGHAIRGGNRRK